MDGPTARENLVYVCETRGSHRYLSMRSTRTILRRILWGALLFASLAGCGSLQSNRQAKETSTINRSATAAQASDFPSAAEVGLQSGHAVR